MIKCNAYQVQEEGISTGYFAIIGCVVMYGCQGTHKGGVSDNCFVGPTTWDEEIAWKSRLGEKKFHFLPGKGTETK